MPSKTQPPEGRGGHAPPPEASDRPEQNIGYDEAVKGAPLTAEERQQAVADSPLVDDEGEDRDDPSKNRSSS